METQQDMSRPATGGPYEEAPGGIAALVCGILGLTAVPLVLSIVSVVLATRARRVAGQDPQHYRANLATAGLILGLIGIGMALISIPLLIGLIFFW
jgi:hypothetical protein